METRRAEIWRSTAPRADARSSLTVLLVVEPGRDGVYRHVEGLVAFLLQQGTRVHLAYSSRRSGAAMRELVERVRLAGGVVTDLRVSNFPEPADSLALLRLAALVRRVRPDVIHAHSSKAGGLARLVALFHRQPRCFYTPHAYYGLAKPPGLQVSFFNQLERMLRGVGRTIAISQDEAGFALKVLGVPPERLLVIHNPVDTARFQPATPTERRAARAQLGLPEDAVVLATIGRMCWQKDPHTAYHAVAPVCAENPGLIMVHLGWGKWKNDLTTLGRQLGYGTQLRMLDYVDDPRAVYHAIDGLLVSSRYEAGWPLVLLEAMACGLPVVASTCVGMSDLGKAGLSHVWTYAPEDVAACTQGVRHWLASTLGPQRESNHCRFATDRLSPERCYGAVLEAYRGNLTGARVSPLP